MVGQILVCASSNAAKKVDWHLVQFICYNLFSCPIYVNQRDSV